MKVSAFRWGTGLSVAALLLSGASLATQADATPRTLYTSQRVSPAGTSDARVHELNDRGDVVGQSASGPWVSVRGRRGALLPTKDAAGTVFDVAQSAIRVGPDGSIAAGAAFVSGPDPTISAYRTGALLRWATASAAPVGLIKPATPPPLRRGTWISVAGIDRSGTIAANRDYAGYVKAGTRVSPAGVETRLDAYDSPNGYLFADIAATGRVVGRGSLHLPGDEPSTRAFTVDGQTVAPLTTPGDPSPTPVAIAPQGRRIVGTSADLGATLWTDRSASRLSGAPQGFTPVGVNDQGDVVGTVDASGQVRAVLVRAGRAEHLTRVIGLRGADSVCGVGGINDRGQIAVDICRASGERYSALLTPRSGWHRR